MFRYSRDVKRCGPGTKAGAPVGVVYCLSTSSFFILKLTFELDGSAFGNGERIFAAFLTGRQYGPLGLSLQAGSCEILPRCSTVHRGRIWTRRLLHFRPSWLQWPPALRRSSPAFDQE